MRTFYPLGGRNSSHFNSDVILSFDAESEKWSTIATMIHARSYHAVSLVILEQFQNYCT